MEPETLRSFITVVSRQLAAGITPEEALKAAFSRLGENAGFTCPRCPGLEERIRELQASNDAITRTMSRLTLELDLDGFFRQALAESMRHLGSTDGVIYLYNAEKHWLIPAQFHFSSPTTPDLSIDAFRDGVSGDDPAWQASLRERGPMIFDLEHDRELFWPGTVEWHQARGNTKVIMAPLYQGEAPIGYLGLAFAESSRLTNSNLQTLGPLTQQIALAIQIKKLADATQCSAIAREREQAAWRAADAENTLIRESNGIARRIHDTLAQGYTAILIQLGAIGQNPRLAGAELAVHLDAIERVARDNLAHARRSLQALRPVRSLSPPPLEEPLDS